MKKFINFFIFLAIWFVTYHLINFNFWVIALIISYMFVYFRTDSELLNGIIFLADEFDKHHNTLNEQLNEFNWNREELMSEISELRKRLEDLERNKEP